MRRRFLSPWAWIALLVALLLTGQVLSRWAFAPVTFTTYLGPSRTWTAALIRDYWPHVFIKPEWFGNTPDVYEKWAFLEAAVRLALVAFTWLSLVAWFVIRYRRRQRLVSPAS